MADSNKLDDQKEDWYKVYNKIPNPEFPNFPVTFLNVSLLILGASITMKIVFALYLSSMGNSDLFSARGEITNIFLGGDGKVTYFDLRSSGSVERYHSFLGKVWPGMASLKKGEVVDVLAWEQGKPFEYPDPRPHYYIWKMTKGSEIIIRGDDIRVLKEKSDNTLNRFSNWILLFSTILTAAAYTRHLKLRADTNQNNRADQKRR